MKIKMRNENENKESTAFNFDKNDLGFSLYAVWLQLQIIGRSPRWE